MTTPFKGSVNANSNIIFISIKAQRPCETELKPQSRQKPRRNQDPYLVTIARGNKAWDYV